jgi:hypothetical protein
MALAGGCRCDKSLGYREGSPVCFSIHFLSEGKEGLLMDLQGLSMFNKAIM